MYRLFRQPILPANLRALVRFIDEKQNNRVIIARIYPPAEVRAGEPFPARAKVDLEQCTPGGLRSNEKINFILPGDVANRVLAPHRRISTIRKPAETEAPFAQYRRSS